MEINRFNFPGGEVHVKLHDLGTEETANLTHFIRNSDDSMALFLITDALRRSGKKHINLTLPYVPYARQDRVMVEGEPLSIKVFADLINVQDYDSVTIWDPHSDVTPALINNCKVVHQHEIIGNNIGVIGTSRSPHVLVCPDAGARKKIMKVAQTLHINDVIFADKVRDVATGKITGTTLSATPERWKDLPRVTDDLIMVDDICDGGYTFIELAKLLRPLTSGKIKLYVTHGIFSKGLSVFDGLIDEIYTANCWLDTMERAKAGNKTSTSLHLVTP